VGVVHSVDLGQHCHDDMHDVTHSNMSPRTGATGNVRAQCAAFAHRCLFIHFCLAVAFNDEVAFTPLDDDIEDWMTAHVEQIRTDPTAKRLSRAARVTCAEQGELRPVVVSDDVPLTGPLAAASIALRRLLPVCDGVCEQMRHLDNWSADFPCPPRVRQRCPRHPRCRLSLLGVAR